MEYTQHEDGVPDGHGFDAEGEYIIEARIPIMIYVLGLNTQVLEPEFRLSGGIKKQMIHRIQLQVVTRRQSMQV